MEGAGFAKSVKYLCVACFSEVNNNLLCGSVPEITLSGAIFQT